MMKKACFILVALVLIQGIQPIPFQQRGLISDFFGFAGQLIESLSNAALQVIREFSEIALNFANSVAQRINIAVGNITDRVRDIVAGIGLTIQNINYAISHRIIGPTVQAAKNAIENLRSQVQLYGSSINQALNDLGANLQNNLEKVIGDDAAIVIQGFNRLNETINQLIADATSLQVEECLDSTLNSSELALQNGIYALEGCVNTTIDLVNTQMDHVNAEIYVVMSTITQLLADLQSAIPDRISLAYLTSNQLQPFIAAIDSIKNAAQNYRLSVEAMVIIGQNGIHDLWDSLHQCLAIQANNAANTIDNYESTARLCLQQS